MSDRRLQASPLETAASRNPRFREPRAAYVHVPFCRHRCGYCNFTVLAGRDDLTERFLSAIHLELSWLQHPRAIDTLFFGGGTPTHLAPEHLSRLIDNVRQWFELERDCEFSVEANPLDITPLRLNALRAGGVTRLSLGVQSFHDRKLAMLERDHRHSDLARIIPMAQSTIPDVSLDLIFGTPGETLEDWRDDLSAAIRFRPQDVSVYGLTWERGTSFWSRRNKGELNACGEDDEHDMYESAIELLTDAGYEHYEVSNFALPGHRCRHNENYWMGGTYFAAGPGAARHVDGRREMNHRSTTTYLQKVLANQSPVAETETLSDEDSARERFIFGMRRLEGVDEETFTNETGLSFRSLFAEPLERFMQLGLIEQRGARVQLTRHGLLVSDSLWPEFL